MSKDLCYLGTTSRYIPMKDKEALGLFFDYSPLRLKLLSPCLVIQTASSDFPQLSSEWVVAYLYDITYLYLRTVDKMVTGGLDFRNGAMLFNLSQTIEFIGWYNDTSLCCFYLAE